LKLLHDVGFVDCLRPRVSRTLGSSEWIYRVSDLGWRTLLDAGAAADGQEYTPAELTSIGYVEHDVQVTALVTRLAALAARAAGCGGPLVDAAPFRMVGPRAGAIDPRYEEPAADPSEFGAHRPTYVRLERATRGVLKPDATLLWEVDGTARVAVMIEYDRTRRATKQLRRLRRYDWFLAEGWRASRYATLDGEPIVLVVCADERQLRPFARAADAELTAWVRDDASSLRAFSTHPGREQVGFTTRERLLTGNWDLLLVPPTPPSERDGSDREAKPIAFTLELDRIGLPAAGQ
jgi:Replication-relaxation